MNPWQALWRAEVEDKGRLGNRMHELGSEVVRLKMENIQLKQSMRMALLLLNTQLAKEQRK